MRDQNSLRSQNIEYGEYNTMKPARKFSLLDEEVIF